VKNISLKIVGDESAQNRKDNLKFIAVRMKIINALICDKNLFESFFVLRSKKRCLSPCVRLCDGRVEKFVPCY